MSLVEKGGKTVETLYSSLASSHSSTNITMRTLFFFFPGGDHKCGPPLPQFREMSCLFWGHLQDECNQNARDEPHSGKTLRVSPVTLGSQNAGLSYYDLNHHSCQHPAKQWTSKWQKLCLCSKPCS